MEVNSWFEVAEKKNFKTALDGRVLIVHSSNAAPCVSVFIFFLKTLKCTSPMQKDEVLLYLFSGFCFHRKGTHSWVKLSVSIHLITVSELIHHRGDIMVLRVIVNNQVYHFLG